MSENKLVIYSWNVLDTNKSEDEVLKFLNSTSFDAFCLQEVSEKLLENLKELPFNMVYEKDFIREIKGKEVPCYIAILTPHKIENSKGSFIDRRYVPKLQTTIFIKLACLMGGGWTRLSKQQSGMYADIVLPTGQRFRIFSVHLSTRGSKERLNAFKIITEHLLSNEQNIIAGDFNVIDNSNFNGFNWLLGATFSESVPWYQERKLMETAFSNAGFINSLKNQGTITAVKNQTDHILTPKETSVLGSEVLKDSFGSDHYPVKVVIKI